MEKAELSIVIPCYNEEKNLPLILERFKEVIKNNSIELILVNNGSLDNSQQVLDKLLPSYSFAKSITVKVNQGYGYGIVQGLREATADVIGYTHADLQTDPADVIKAFDLYNALKSEAVYVKGNRKGRPIFDQFFTTGMSYFESLYLGTKLWDINAQPNIFPKSFFCELSYLPKDFSLDLYLLYMARRKGLEIERFDVLFPERLHGTSSWNTGLKSKWKFIKRTIDFSIKLKKQI